MRLGGRLIELVSVCSSVQGSLSSGLACRQNDPFPAQVLRGRLVECRGCRSMMTLAELPHALPQCYHVQCLHLACRRAYLPIHARSAPPSTTVARAPEVPKSMPRYRSPPGAAGIAAAAGARCRRCRWRWRDAVRPLLSTHLRCVASAEGDDAAIEARTTGPGSVAAVRREPASVDTALSAMADWERCSGGRRAAMRLMAPRFWERRCAAGGRRDCGDNSGQEERHR
eukprot:366028-Chlamydomonas_euryale.AAC.25